MTSEFVFTGAKKKMNEWMNEKSKRRKNNNNKQQNEFRTEVELKKKTFPEKKYIQNNPF